MTVADHSARLNLTFFNQRHMTERLQYGREYIFYGAVSGDFISAGMTNPVFEAPEEPPLVTRRILPVYPLTGGLSNRAVSKAIAQALESCGTPPEILPPIGPGAIWHPPGGDGLSGHTPAVGQRGIGPSPAALGI